MSRITRYVLSALLLGSSALAAAAADVAPTPAPVALETFEPWQVRLQAAGVIPQSTSGQIYTNNFGTGDTGNFVANGLKASDAVIGAADISYFFTKNVAVSLFCCISYHNLYLNDGAFSGLKVANTLLFPPALTIQYHWRQFGPFQWYLGVGVNYTHYFSTHPSYPDFNWVHIQDSWGIVGQIGFDYMIDDHWGVNFDVKKVVMQPNVYASVPAVPTAGGPLQVKGVAHLDPWIIGAGITYRFGGPSTGLFHFTY
jgi:outer membrane protein